VTAANVTWCLNVLRELGSSRIEQLTFLQPGWSQHDRYYECVSVPISMYQWICHPFLCMKYRTSKTATYCSPHEDMYSLSPVWTLTQLVTDSLNAFSHVTFVWFLSSVNSTVHNKTCSIYKSFVVTCSVILWRSACLLVHHFCGRVNGKQSQMAYCLVFWMKYVPYHTVPLIVAQMNTCKVCLRCGLSCNWLQTY